MKSSNFEKKFEDKLENFLLENLYIRYRIFFFIKEAFLLKALHQYGLKTEEAFIFLIQMLAISLAQDKTMRIVRCY